MVDLGPGMSHAVVARRHESPTSLDDFPTPPWATRAFMEHVLKPSEFGYGIHRASVWEPACGRGFMSRPLAESFQRVVSTDVVDYGWKGQDGTSDYLSENSGEMAADWIITNPPFKRAHDFIDKAILRKRNIAVLVRTSFVEGIGRYNRLFKSSPPNIIAQYSERVPMVRGRIDKNASTATAYCWMVWGQQEGLSDSSSCSKFVWIPPCRKDFERDEDYQF